MGRISLVVAPGAHRSEVIGPHGGAWKVRIAASPERGRANEELRALLAGALGVARDDVQVVSGHASRRKVVEVAALEADEIDRRLAAAVS